MRAGLVARSVVLALVAILSAATVASADTVVGDSDTVTADVQATLDLGAVAPGAVLHVPIDFLLSCMGLWHVDPGQTVHLSMASVMAPDGGDATATDGAVGPAPATWADDTHGSVGCPVPTPAPLSASTPSEATIVAPMTVGGPYAYSISFGRTVTPDGSNDISALTSPTKVTFSLTVVANTPPTLSLPADVTHEGNTTGGWVGTWTASAADAEDSPPPTPVCAPAAGTLFGLGTTTVHCSVVDSGGLTANGLFHVTVVDTTPPQLVDVPGPISAVSGSGGGVAVSYTIPTATDTVDPNPQVDCAPASGSIFPVGTTNVHCTATDASANATGADFPVTVSAGNSVRVTFAPPIGPDGTVTIHSRHWLPVRLSIVRNGVVDRTGPVSLAITDLGPGAASTPCRGAHHPGWWHHDPPAPAGTVRMWLHRHTGQWWAELHFSHRDLAHGHTYRVDVVDQGSVVGSFTIVIAGDHPAD